MTETIAAIATATAPAGIGIIRISGSDAIEIADRIYFGKNEKRLSDQKGNTIHYGWIKENNETIDEVLVSVFKDPHSYTGEDSVEINCHGGVIAVNKILEAVLRAGARLAEPGEFTKRAYLNGRLDISEAEAVMDIISAKSEYALQSSVSQLKGGLNRKISSVREKLIYELAFIESALDDPEHISLDGYSAKLYEIVKEQIDILKKLRDTSEKGKYIEEGIKTVILGKPNVGKSSLLNMLAGKQRAIVTEIPGTTRDIIEETVPVGKTVLRIIDTAGIHESDDKVEKIGIDLAWEKAEEADLILYVIDSSEILNDNDREILDKIKEKKGILILNKIDKEQIITKEDVKEISGFPIIEISAKEEIGEELLRETIQKMFFEGDISFNDQVFITNIRHKKLLDESIDSLILVKNSIEDEMPEDFYSIDLMGAIGALDNIIGGNLSEDLVNEIFSKFCMGK
ncbi:MAG: tRNA uridine-5-carboxymethylaminomethyl(34) synthesis GTPase MnmE [Lachnospiraceae bacterium]|nr:tRNA uridine-5-carboxymethylaminomethyl(34) synthesis GTPase MnmE [Lachnospiraceae bacterium]MDY6221633.1 tRNA uridine-5-carboxymethylaminomethyl(34) synthesis GTPase MnmE [Candidatus Alectryocaccobium sp.]